MNQHLRVALHAAWLAVFPVISCAPSAPAPAPIPGQPSAPGQKQLASTSTASGKGIALSIGLNRVSTDHYPGDGKLFGCENDATDLANIARSQGFETKTLFTKRATKKAVRDAVEDASKRLKSGDTFVIAFSGHGNRALDENDDESDGQDETWCLYDGQVIDDEIGQWWSKFDDGVRILMISDSCHSETVLKIFDKNRVEIPDPAARSKAFTKGQMDALLAMPENQGLDKSLPRERDSRKNTSATVVSLAACQDKQTASDALPGARNSLFTSRLLGIWASGTYQGNLNGFFEKVRTSMAGDKQRPAINRLGKANPHFESQRPWSR